MTIHHLALLIGLFGVPLAALGLGFKFRKRTPRARAVFWGAVIGHTLATVLASVAAIWPPRVPGPGEETRAALILWTLLAGGVIGALIALLRDMLRDRDPAVAVVAVVLAGAGAAAGVGACTGDADAVPIGELRSLDVPAAPGSREPNLAVAGDGTVLMTWTEPSGDSAWALRIAALNGDEWDEPATVVSGRPFFVNWADFPSAISLPGNRLAVHWLERSAGGTYEYDVRIAQSLDGGRTWSPDVIPHRDGTKSEHGFVSLYEAGQALLGAVWLDGRKFADSTAPREMTLAHTTLASDGELGLERMLDGRICECCQTGGALTDAGPVIVYRDRSEDEIRDIAIVRSVGGEWTEPRHVHEDGWHVEHCPVNGPAVAARGRDVAVAWFTGARDTARVTIAFSRDAGESFAAPIRVDGGSPLGRVDVELLDDGRAAVTWLERTEGGEAEVRLRAVAADGGMSEPMALAATSGARASGFPRMARQGDRLVFAWTVPGEPSVVRVAAAPLR